VRLACILKVALRPLRQDRLPLPQPPHRAIVLHSLLLAQQLAADWRHLR